MPVWRHGAQTAALIADPAGRRPDRLRADALAKPPRPRAAAALGARSPRSARSPPPCCFWQTRAGPAAQLLSIPGATALVWTAGAWVLGFRQPARAGRAASSSPSGRLRPGQRPGHRSSSPRPLDQGPAGGQHRQQPLPDPRARWRRSRAQPRGMVLTFVDLGPAADHGHATTTRSPAPITATRGRSST